MEATVRANAPVLGMQRGQTERVELTPFIEAVAANGKITILERHCPAVEAILSEPEPESDTGPDLEPGTQPGPVPDAVVDPAQPDDVSEAGWEEESYGELDDRDGPVPAPAADAAGGLDAEGPGSSATPRARPRPRRKPRRS